MKYKLIDANKPVLTPNGDVYCEPKVDRMGRILLDDGTYKFQHQLTTKDTVTFKDFKVGNILTFLLDQKDDKATGEVLRKRFFISCAIEKAMQDGTTAKVVTSDIKHIEEAIENIKNPLFSYRAQEALDEAILHKEVATSDA